MAETLFWSSFLVVAFVYFGYPLLLLGWERLARWPVRKRNWTPCVSLIMAVHNERENIEGKLLNCFALDYPKEKLQIIVSLDGPTDGTEELLWGYANRGIQITYSREQRGKAVALNRAVAAAQGEVLVFTDARQCLDGRAVRELVANFRDPFVGAVSGELVLLDTTGREARDGIGLYWRYEKWLRSLESNIHSMLGATGALYAIRRELYRRIPEETILDDVFIPLSVVFTGKRAVFDPSARAYDAVTCCPEAEYRRKRRTLSGNYQLLTRMPELLIPFRNPVFAQFLFHKIGRLLVPYFLITMFLSNLFARSGKYAVFLTLQLLWYSMACVGHLICRRHRAAHGIHSFNLSGREERA